MKSALIRTTVLACFLCTWTFSEMPADTFTTIDGFTSATVYRSLRIVSGKIYRDRAELQWLEYWKQNDKVSTYKIQWETEEGKDKQEIDLLPYTHEVISPIVLDKLVPGTKYYARFHRCYNAHNYITNFVFTTPPLDRISPAFDGSASPVSVSGSRPMYSPQTKDPVASFELTTMSGKRMYHTGFSTMQNTKIAIRSIGLAPGVYIATFRNAKNIPVASGSFLVE